MFTGPFKGLEKIWILGDKFMFGSYNRYFYQQPEENYYIRRRFEVSSFMSNLDHSVDTNIVSRFRNLLAGTIAENPLLPKLIVLVPDADIISFYGQKSNAGSSRGFAYMLNWIMHEHNKILDIYKDKLPEKCKKAYYPQMVWIELPGHTGFSEEQSELRARFNTSLREIAKSHENISVLELKKIWNPKDPELYSVENECFSAAGLRSYWLVVDRTLQFCDTTIMHRVAKFELRTLHDDKPFGADCGRSPDSKDPATTSPRRQSHSRDSDNDSLSGIEPIRDVDKDPDRRTDHPRHDHRDFNFDRYHWQADGQERRSSFPQNNFHRPGHARGHSTFICCF